MRLTSYHFRLTYVLFLYFSLFDIARAQIEVPNPAFNGPFEYSSYEYPASNNGFQSARIYLPESVNGQPLPAVVVSGGYSNQKEDMSWLSNRLASHGFVVLAFTPTNIYGDNRIFAEGHLAGVEVLINQNRSAGSPLFGKIDFENIGVTGYSMGGGGAHLAAQASDQISTAVLLSPYLSQRTVYNRSGSTLVMVGGNDTTAVPSQHAIPLYNDLTTSTKVYFEFNNLPHYAPTNYGSSSSRAMLSRYLVSWMNFFLKPDGESYRAWLARDGDQLNSADFSNRKYN